MIKARRNLFASTTFRYTLVYLLVLVLGLMALFGSVYWATTTALSRQIESTIDAEIKGLAEHYRRAGRLGLIATVRERAGQARTGPAIYLLVDQRFRVLAGNLSAWPLAEPNEEGWVQFSLAGTDDSEAETHAKAQVFSIAGMRLLVGHDVRERLYVENAIRESLAWALGAVVLLTGLAGYFLSRRLLGRIDKVSEVSQDIMAGDFSRRVSLSGEDDEFDDLARSLNAMLAQVEKLMIGLREVTDNVAHDLRSPLARLRSRIEVALLESDETSDHRALLGETIAEADRLLATFNALLTIAEAEAGVSSNRSELFDAVALAEDIADLYGAVAEEANCRLLFEGEPGERNLFGDKDLLAQALNNLIENALRYGQEGGEVRLAVQVVGVDLHILVEDRGPGIPVEERERVTERFYRIDPARSGKGNGLGLSLVAAVADLYGGGLNFEDNDPGLRVRLIVPLGLQEDGAPN